MPIKIRDKSESNWQNGDEAKTKVKGHAYFMVKWTMQLDLADPRGSSANQAESATTWPQRKHSMSCSVGTYTTQYVV